MYLWIIKFHAQGNNGGLDEVQTQTQQAIIWSDPTGNQLVRLNRQSTSHI